MRNIQLRQSQFDQELWRVNEEQSVVILDQKVVNRNGLGILGKVAKNAVLAASISTLGLWGLYSSLETYQQERLKSAAVVHLAAMAPSGMLELYQEERIQRALKSDEPSD